MSELCWCDRGGAVGHVTVSWAHISTSPGIEPVEMLYPGPVRWGPVRGRTPSRVATHDGSGSSHRSADRERRPGGHRARHGRLGDSAHRLRQSGTEHVHTCASIDANVTLGAIPVSYRARSSTQVRVGLPRRRAEGAASPISVVEPIQGLWVSAPRCSHGARSSDPAVGDRERRPGGHRARHGRWAIQQIGSTEAGQIMSTHLHSW